jgi:hypothetical protein
MWSLIIMRVRDAAAVLAVCRNICAHRAGQAANKKLLSGNSTLPAAGHNGTAASIQSVLRQLGPTTAIVAAAAVAAAAALLSADEAEPDSIELWQRREAARIRYAWTGCSHSVGLNSLGPLVVAYHIRKKGESACDTREENRQSNTVGWLISSGLCMTWSGSAALVHPAVCCGLQGMKHNKQTYNTCDTVPLSLPLHAMDYRMLWLLS